MRKLIVILLCFLLVTPALNGKRAQASGLSTETSIKQIETSGNLTMYLSNNGDLMSWTTIQDGSPNIKKVAGDIQQFSLDSSSGYIAIKSNGEVINKSNRFSNDEVDLKRIGKVKQVAHNIYEYRFINEKNELWAFSMNAWGNPVTQPEKVMDNVKQVSTSDSGTFIVTTKDELWAYGNSMSYAIDAGFELENGPVKIMDNVEKVQLGSDYDSFVIALKTNGEVWGWGKNPSYQIGKNLPDIVEEPSFIISDIIDLSVGANYSMAIDSEGQLWGWGGNIYGQIGNDSVDAVGTPKMVMQNVSKVATSLNDWDKATFVVRNDNTIWGWGSNSYNILSSSTSKDILTPIKIIEIQNKPSVVTGVYNNASEWAKPELVEAEKKGLLSPVINESFKAKITREKFSGIVIKFYEALTGESLATVAKNPFTDTVNAEVLKAYDLGIVKGISPSKFSPNNFITREEMSVMLIRALDKAKPEFDYNYDYFRFEDEKEFSTWSQSSIKLLRSMGIILGDTNNNFNPKKSTTIEEASVMVYRLLKAADK